MMPDQIRHHPCCRHPKSYLELSLVPQEQCILGFGLIARSGTWATGCAQPELGDTDFMNESQSATDSAHDVVSSLI